MTHTIIPIIMPMSSGDSSPESIKGIVALYIVLNAVCITTWIVQAVMYLFADRTYRGSFKDYVFDSLVSHFANIISIIINVIAAIAFLTILLAAHL